MLRRSFPVACSYQVTLRDGRELAYTATGGGEKREVGDWAWGGLALLCCALAFVLCRFLPSIIPCTQRESWHGESSTCFYLQVLSPPVTKSQCLEILYRYKGDLQQARIVLTDLLRTWSARYPSALHAAKVTADSRAAVGREMSIRLATAATSAVAAGGGAASSTSPSSTQGAGALVAPTYCVPRFDSLFRPVVNRTYFPTRVSPVLRVTSEKLSARACGLKSNVACNFVCSAIRASDFVTLSPLEALLGMP